MSKKLVLTAALGLLSSVLATGCHHGGCGGGGCGSGCCSTPGYPASGYGPEYASTDEGYEEVVDAAGPAAVTAHRPAAVTAHRPASHCANGSCQH